MREHVAHIRISAHPDHITLEKGEGLNPVLLRLVNSYRVSEKNNNNLPGFGGGNLSKNSSTKNIQDKEFSSGEEKSNTDEQSEGGVSAPSSLSEVGSTLGVFSSPNSFGTFATKSTENGV